MKTKIMIVSLLAVFVLLMMPSVPAVEYNVAVETNKSRLIEELQTIDIEELEQRLKSIDNEKIQEIVQNIDFEQIKQKIQDLENSPYIDFLAIFMILCNIITTLLVQKTKPARIIGTISLTLIVLMEFFTGEPVPKCPKVYSSVIIYIASVVMGIEYRIIKNKVVLTVVQFITLTIAMFLANILTILLSSSNSPNNT